MMSFDAFVTDFRDPSHAFAVACFFLGLGQAVTSLEYLRLSRQFGRGGMYNWPVLRYAAPVRSAPATWLREKMFCQRGTIVLLVLRLLLAISLIVFCTNEAVALASLVGVFIMSLIFFYKLPWGFEAAEQVVFHSALGLLAFGLCRWAGAPDLGLSYGASAEQAVPLGWFHAPHAGLYYVAAYCALVYATNGVSKWCSKEWRRGEALDWAFNLQGFGAHWMANLLTPRPRLRLVLAWTVILLESLAPLAIFLPAEGIVIALAFGVLFHIFNGLTMGLNTFLYAFLPTYPVVLFVWTVAHSTPV